MEKAKNKSYTLRFAKANQQTWQFIKEGKKTVETRAATIRYLPIKVGDILIFSCNGKKFSKQVKKVVRFKTIPAVFKKYKPIMINPSVKTAKEMIDRWYSFPDYKEKIAEYGLLAFELE